MSPPRNAMSVPLRIRRVKVGQGRGARETRIDVDDRRAAFFRFHYEAEPHRVASAKFEPSIRMQSALTRSCTDVVAPPRPN